MIHFAYPNVDASGRFVGCGRYAVSEANSVPSDVYALVTEPATPNIAEIREAALYLTPTDDGIRRVIYEKRDVHDYPYQGASLDFAYLLALIHCRRPLKFAATAYDFWCTGSVNYAGNTPILKPVDQQGFDNKLKAFLLTDTPETIFFAHHVNVAHQRQDVKIITLQDVSPESIFDQKTVIIIGRKELPQLIDLLFESPAGATQPAVLQNPYRGLFAFRETDAPFFFGREDAIEQLMREVQTKPIVAVVGPSGSGKSSVAQAGLFPRLRKQGDWLIASFRPGEYPFYQLAHALYALQKPEMDELERAEKSKKAAAYLLNATLTLSEAVKSIFESHPQRRLLLYIDQFEELYTMCRAEEIRRRFLDVLITACHVSQTWQQSDWQITCVLSMRADFLEQASAYRPFADALRHALFVLGPMNRKELRDVIEQPARVIGFGLEDGLAERMLDAVGDEPGNLPLLEFALTQLWDEIGETASRMMTHAAYDHIGGIAQALSRYADGVFQRLPDDEQEQAKQLFMQLVRPGEGTEDFRRIANRSELGEDLWRLAIKLAHARLVVTNHQIRASSGQSVETVELVHEALLRHWERLRDWRETERNFRVWQERVRGMMQQSQAQAQQGWQLFGRRYDRDLVLRGKSLKEAKQWLKRKRTELSADEQRFIAYCKQLLLWQKLKRIVLSILIGLGLGLLISIAIFVWMMR